MRLELNEISVRMCASHDRANLIKELSFTLLQKLIFSDLWYQLLSLRS